LFFHDLNFSVGQIDDVIELQAPPNWRSNNVAQRERHVLAACIKGEAQYCIDGRIQQVSEGNLCYFPAGVITSGKCGEYNPWQFIQVSFTLLHDGKSSNQILSPLAGISTNAVHRDNKALLELNRLWREKPCGYVIRCRSLIQDVLYDLIATKVAEEQQPIHVEKMEQVRAFLLKNYKSDYSVCFLADYSGFSESHFRMLFKEITGFTATQYVNDIRIQKAKELLLSGQVTVTEVGKLTGFSDLYYFSRLFKKVTGVSPSFYFNHFDK